MWVTALKVIWGIIAFFLRRKKNKAFDERLSRLEAQFAQFEASKASPDTSNPSTDPPQKRRSSQEQQQLEQTLLLHDQKITKQFYKLYKEGIELLEVRPQAALSRLKKAQALAPHCVDHLFLDFIALTEAEIERRKKERETAYARWFEARSNGSLGFRGLFLGGLTGLSLALLYVHLLRQGSSWAEPLLLLGAAGGWVLGLLGGVRKSGSFERGAMLHSLLGALHGTLLLLLGLFFLLLWNQMTHPKLLPSALHSQPFPWQWLSACTLAGAFTGTLLLTTTKQLLGGTPKDLLEGIRSGGWLAFTLTFIALLSYFITLYNLPSFGGFRWQSLPPAILLLVSLTLFGLFFSCLLAALTWSIMHIGLPLYLFLLFALGWLTPSLQRAPSLRANVAYQTLQDATLTTLAIYQGKKPLVSLRFFRAILSPHKKPLTPFQRYKQKLRRTLLHHLNPPKTKATPTKSPKQPKKKLAIWLKISHKGRLQDTKIQTSSGDKALDLAALKAAYNAAPFPVPPKKIWPKLKTGLTLHLYLHKK